MGASDTEYPVLDSMKAIIARAREICAGGEPHRVAVAAAHDDAAIEAAMDARKEGVADVLLTGDSKRIHELITEAGGNPADYDIIGTKDDEETAVKVAEACSEGRADIILKGIIPTGKLLRTVLNQKYGIRRKGLLSHSAVLAPERYPKLLNITDGGMVIKPTFDQKVEIIRNAVLVAWALGIKQPRVAILTSIDYVLHDFQETFEAAALSKMADRDQIKGCLVDGPMSFDTAIWKEAGEWQRITSQVAGEADIVVAGSIEEGNILAKSMVQFGGATFAGVILGARVPISLVSRADKAFNKLASMALAVVVSHYLKFR